MRTLGLLRKAILLVMAGRSLVEGAIRRLLVPVESGSRRWPKSELCEAEVGVRLVGDAPFRLPAHLADPARRRPHRDLGPQHVPKKCLGPTGGPRDSSSRRNTRTSLSAFVMWQAGPREGTRPTCVAAENYSVGIDDRGRLVIWGRPGWMEPGDLCPMWGSERGGAVGAFISTDLWPQRSWERFEEKCL